MQLHHWPTHISISPFIGWNAGGVIPFQWLNSGKEVVERCYTNNQFSSEFRYPTMLNVIPWVSSLFRHRDPNGQHRRWSKAIDVGYWDSRSVGYQIAGSRVGLDTSWCGCTYTPIPTNPPGFIRMHVDWIGRALDRVHQFPNLSARRNGWHHNTNMLVWCINPNTHNT
jgi:hypothetical protein